MAAQVENSGCRIRLSATKVKEGPLFQALDFDLITVSGIGQDSSGRPVDSAKVVASTRATNTHLSHRDERKLSHAILDLLATQAPLDGMTKAEVNTNIDGNRATVYREINRLIEEGCVIPDRRQKTVLLNITDAGRLRRQAWDVALSH